jgi:hypothetical protein
MKTAGWVMTGVGIGSFVVGLSAIVVGDDEGDDDLMAGGAVLVATGTVLMAVGIPILAVGGGQKRRALREFERQYYTSNPPASYFQLNLYPNKVGLAYVF